MSDKFCVTIKLSRWRAKIVTSLLPQPSVLWARPYLFVSVPENCLGIDYLDFLSQGLSNRLSCYWNFYYLGEEEKNFKILNACFASSSTKLRLRVGLRGFGNVLAKGYEHTVEKWSGDPVRVFLHHTRGTHTLLFRMIMKSIRAWSHSCFQH
jgi:hypothetical protein